MLDEGQDDVDIRNAPSLDFATRQDRLRFLDTVIEKILEKVENAKSDVARVTFEDHNGLRMIYELLEITYDYNRRFRARFKKRNERVKSLEIKFAQLVPPNPTPYIEIKIYRNE